MNKIKSGFFVFFFMIGLVGLTRVSASSYDLYEYAGLSGVAMLGFDGKYNSNNYDVNIKTSEIDILTGEDNKEYRCWAVQGTGYTDTLGEVFFNYNSQSSYICNDGKRRGRAKLSAGGRIDFEGDDEGSVYSGQLQKEKYENNESGERKYFYHKTGSKAYTEGLGFWNWELVKTKFDYIGENLNLIDFEKSNLNFSGSFITANGNEKNGFTIKFLDENNERFDYLIVPKLEFTKDTFTYSNGLKTGLSFSNFNDPTYVLKDTEVSGNYKDSFYSIVPGTGQIYMNFGSGYVLTGNNARWSLPFDINFQLEDGNGNNKILQHDNEKAKLKLIQNDITITDHSFDISTNLSSNWNIENGLYNAKIDNQWFDFRVYDKNENSSDAKLVNYFLSGYYNIEKDGNYFTGIKTSYFTNGQEVYLNKNIDNIDITKPDCNQKLGNAKSWCKLGFEFNNEYGQNLSNMSYDIVAIEDLNKDDGNYSSFDLDEFSESNYTTGFYFSGYSSKTNDNGISTGKILSYKPVRNAKLSFVFSNITGTSQDAYDWHTDNNYTGTIKNISFDPVVELAFSGIDLGDGIAINSDNEIEIEYGLKDGVDVDILGGGDYFLTGKIISDLPNSFEEGGTFTGNFGTSQNQNIYISGDYFDYITYYNDYYKYKINGIDGYKEVKLKPNKRINSNLVIVPKFMGSKVMGLINKGFSLLATHSYFGDGSSNKIVGTSSNSLNKKLNKTKMEYENKLRGINPDNVTSEKRVNLSDFDGKEKYYKCSSDGKINLIEGEYTNQNEIVLYGCPLSIKGDILKTNKGDSLKIVSFDSESKFDFNSSEGWLRKSNIYIHPNVNTIQSNIITDGAVFTIKNSLVNFENIFFGGRGRIPDLQNQLYINGQIISKNTYGGGVVDSNNQVVLPGGYKVDKDNLIYGKKAYKIAQAFDINFWRSTYNQNDGYNTDKLSDLVETRFGCTEQDSDPYQCTKPVLIEK